MAMSGSFMDNGSDEVTGDGVTDVCSFCASDGYLQPALYFCFDCGKCGRYICVKCLKNHSKFTCDHEVKKISNLPTTKRARITDSEHRELKEYIGDLQRDKSFFRKERLRLMTDIEEVTTEKDELSKKLREVKIDLGKELIDEAEEEEIHHDFSERHNSIMEKVKGRNNSETRQNEPIADNSTVEAKERLLVAAIDIGNTSSRTAFSFRHEYTIHPLRITASNMRKMSLDSPVTFQVPTVVLFDENRKFHSFGYDAERSYSKLAGDGEHQKWFFFKHFVLEIQDRDVPPDFELHDKNGRKMKAVDVFGAVINHIKDHLLAQIKTKGIQVHNKEIHWVLPLPAILTDSATQFMREAALQANIDSRHLSVILDPVAASIYYNMFASIRQRLSLTSPINISCPGLKYMVIDLREKITYFTVFANETEEKGNILLATKEACGARMVEEEFLKLIRNVTSDAVYQTFKHENNCDQSELRHNIEKAILKVKPETSGKITVIVPIELAETYKVIKKESIQEAVNKSAFKGQLSWLVDKVRLDAKMVQNMFKPYTDMLVRYIKDILKRQNIQNTSTILMVGEFSGCVMVQDMVEKTFQHIKVAILDEPGLAVLKGAVIYGHEH